MGAETTVGSYSVDRPNEQSMPQPMAPVNPVTNRHPHERDCRFSGTPVLSRSATHVHRGADMLLLEPSDMTNTGDTPGELTAERRVV
jgi:hypothetical protein